MIITKNNSPSSAESINEDLVLFEAFNGNVHLAKALCDKFDLNDPTIAARLSYLSGEHEKAIELAKISNDVYLHCEILTATNKFDEALSVLKNEPLGPLYYYYSGVIYNHTREFKKSIACLEKAYDAFKNDSHEIRKLMTLANLAVGLNASGEIAKATEIFNNAAKLIDDSFKKNFPKFCSKFFVSYGFQLMQTGKLYLSYKYLKIAEKLINENRSEEYFRCQVFLGYVMKQLGYFTKAILVLDKVAPKVSYLNLDRLRYLAECYLYSGELEKSKLTVSQALKLSEQDKFSQIFLNLVSYQIQIFEKQDDSAKDTFARIELLCNELEDHISLSFALGKKAYLTNDFSLARDEMEKLFRLEFHVEALECSLILCRKLIAEGSYEKALTSLNKLDLNSYPVQKIEGSLLKALCYKFTDQKLKSIHEIDLALQLARRRKDNFLLAKCLMVQIQVSSDLSEIVGLQKKYIDTVSYLESWQNDDLDNFFTSLNRQTKFKVNIRNKSYSLSLLEFSKQTQDHTGFILDVENQRLIYRDQIFNELKCFPVQWNLLKLLADCSSSEPLTKELFAFRILERTSYNPISDDNNINVTIHRLRKTLKSFLGFDPIVSKQGNYYLSQEYKVAILESIETFRVPVSFKAVNI